MTTKILNLIDFEKVDILLEGFNKSTGFVTAILDLDGNVLSKSGWRQICTEFHRVHPETSKRCTISDTVLAGKLAENKKYHFYKCFNGLVDVAVPIVIKGEHIANLFSGQFFFEEPDISFFEKQAAKYSFNQERYLKALEKVPVISQEKVQAVMDFLLNMTQLISELTYQKMEQIELNEARYIIAKSLSESEEYNRTLFIENAIGLALTTMDGRFIDINPAFAKIIGRSIDESLKLTTWDITPEKQLTQEQQHLKNLNETGSYVPYEKEYVHKDGQLVPISFQGKTIERNGIKYILVSIKDISERKNAEATLRESEERFRKVFEEGPIGMAMANLATGNLFSVNKALCNMLGYTEEELLQLTFLEVTLPEDRARDIEAVRNLNDGLIQNHFAEKRYLSKSGDVIWGARALTKIFSESDQVYYALVIIENINERKSVEKSLLESERRFHDSLENIKLLAAQINFNGEVIYCNPYLCKLSGYTREEIVGSDWFEIFVPKVRQDVRELFLKALQNGYIETIYENPLRMKDGSERIILFNNTILRDPEGKVIGTTSIGEDITERKRAEDEIRLFNQTLEQRVVERTAQVQAIIKELETFSYSVSHDLKAPLRGIDGYSKLLLDLYGKDLNDEAQSFLKTIRSSTMQMNQLIEDLLEYSRLERNQLNNDEIKISDIIESILSLYKNELEKRKIKLKFNIPDIKLVADEKGLTIALRNLIENAIKFSSSNADVEPLIEIGIEERTLSWIIYVKDNGIGFDMKYHQRIFEIFQRLQRAEDIPGTGVGLAMVSKTMQRMHGKVWAESVSGMGSTFYLELPKNKLV